MCRHRVNASSNFATVTFFIVFKMCRHRVNAVLDALEIALKASQKTAKPQDDDDFNSNLINPKTTREIKGVGIKTKFKSCIPIPID